MRKVIAGGALALLLAMMPLLVMAQAAPFDEETRSTTVAMAQRVGSTVVPGLVVAVDERSQDDDGGLLEPDIFEDPGAPLPEIEEPEPEPDGDLGDFPPLNLKDLVEYSSQGVTFLAPADWIVELDIDEGQPFIVQVPGTDLFLGLEVDTGLDFPSWLALALFRSQTDMLLQEFGEGAMLVESATLYNKQNVPLIKMAFTGEQGSEAIGGTMYVTAPGRDAYLLVAGGTLESWEYAAPGVDLIAESLVFDEDLITTVWAEDGPLPFTTEDETMSLTVPEGWYALDTGDPQFPVMVAESEVRYVIALGSDDAFSSRLDESVWELIPEEGEQLEPELYEEIIGAILDMILDSGTPFNIDEDLSSVVERDGALTVRLIGDADLDGMPMPIIFYIDLRTDGMTVATVFGETERAIAVEDEILEMVESIVVQ